ncbi:MAG: glycosyltransferase family 1 protein [Patescibacteria group bacterium]
MLIGIDASRANRIRKTGTEWYSFYLIKNLAKIDKNNIYRLYLDVPPTAEMIKAVKDNPNFSFKVLNWPSRFFWTLGRLTWEMIWRRPDVLFVPAHALPLVSPRRTVNTIHDVAFIREQKVYRPEKIKINLPGSRPVIDFFVRVLTGGKYRSGSLDYLRWSTAFALKHAKRIIAVSEFTKKEILELYPKVPEKKIKVVYNGYNRELFRLCPDQERQKDVLEKYGLEQPFFLYVGRLEKKKNTLILVEALALLRENHPGIKEKLVLIGDAGYGYDEIKYAIEEFDLESDVLMPGWADEEDLPYIFSAAKAFIFPSKHEGFGLPVIQAMACDTPIIASDISVLKEIAGEAVKYFKQNNKNSLMETMAEIVNNPSLREELKIKGRTRAKEFDWEKCARETLRVLEESGE